MTLKELTEILDYRVIVETGGYSERSIEHIVAGDLMSEVLVAEEEDILLITALTSDQVVRTANVVDAVGIILVNGKSPQESATKLAEEFGIPIVSTGEAMFECCCSVADHIDK